jgi:hypothetical protein
MMIFINNNNLFDWKANCWSGQIYLRLLVHLNCCSKQIFCQNLRDIQKANLPYPLNCNELHHRLIPWYVFLFRRRFLMIFWSFCKLMLRIYSMCSSREFRLEKCWPFFFLQILDSLLPIKSWFLDFKNFLYF